MEDKTIEFINKAIKIHGDKYDYSKVNYENARKNIIIICKNHYEFCTTPNSHLSKKTGCPQCTKINLSKKFCNTKEISMKRAIEIHGNKYDYSKVEYTNSKEKIIILCKEHGEFKQSPNNHLQGYECKKCGLKKQSIFFRDTLDMFVEKAIKIHDNKYDYTKVEYTNSHTKVKIICNIHSEFEQTPNNHLNGQGCPICGILYNSNLMRFSTKEFIQKAIKIHNNKYNYSKVEYKKISERVIIICKEHGEFLQTPSNHLRGKGCNICGNIEISNKLRNTTENFIEKVIQLHGNKYDYSKSEYGQNNNDKIIIICKEHGEFLQTPNGHLHNSGCIKCGGKHISNTNEFIEKSNIKHNNRYDYSKVEYKKTSEKVIIICKEHGEFLQRPNSHLRGVGCLYCRNKTEFILYKYIQSLYYTLVSQFKQEWCKKIKYLPYDFCIEEYKIIIELDGAQHFRQVRNWTSPEKQFENDKYKEKCANENGYSIIRLLQEDVLNDKYDWKNELINNIEKIKIDNIIQNIYMCKNSEYEMFIN
jgi:very-short-patch-repair endonuclease